MYRTKKAMRSPWKRTKHIQRVSVQHVQSKGYSKKEKWKEVGK